MLIILIATQLALVIKCISVCLQDEDTDKATYYFDKVASIILITIYSATTLFYLPVFIYIMLKLKRRQPLSYNQYKCKFITFFSLFILFLLLRFYIYIDIQVFKYMYNRISSVLEIPLYISEVILTLAISYILFPDAKVAAARQTVHLSRALTDKSSPQSSRPEDSLRFLSGPAM